MATGGANGLLLSHLNDKRPVIRLAEAGDNPVRHRVIPFIRATA